MNFGPDVNAMHDGQDLIHPLHDLPTDVAERCLIKEHPFNNTIVQDFNLAFATPMVHTYKPNCNSFESTNIDVSLNSLGQF